jgi:sortase A
MSIHQRFLLAGCALFMAIGCVSVPADVEPAPQPLLIPAGFSGTPVAAPTQASEPRSTRVFPILTRTEMPAPVEVQPSATIIEPPVEPISATPVADAFVPEPPTRVVIPTIGLDAPVVSVGWSVVNKNGQLSNQWDVPDWSAAGWLRTSARVGEPGNTVLIGHQNIAGRVFQSLENLKPGDMIRVVAGDRSRNYSVTHMEIVPEKDQPLEVRRANAQWIAPTGDERLTLVTCWPRNDNTHRLIVVAVPDNTSTQALPASP